MPPPVEWFLDGLTNFIFGIFLGGGAGSIVTWRLIIRSQRQLQRAGDDAYQIQVGRDNKPEKDA